MNYGQAIEAMRGGAAVCRTDSDHMLVRLSHRNTPLQYFEAIYQGGMREPFTPTVADQLSTHWKVMVSAEPAQTLEAA
ncbi:Thoeris anti-defense Tad2 family protein [Sinorhizobium meliloti]|uniref:Thoeris anti-defense Tad2 family protein n=1 Tax=Rhizobium meliloti TaxID=382 RepID=UPI000FD6E5C4|nr:DUF2829 domain-containing protein [Sinorhizobium meliloti]RVN04627.1 DUF2829 domain-containing protein [Sinorhizobium meliloti]